MNFSHSTLWCHELTCFDIQNTKTMITTINSALKYTSFQQMELLSEVYVFIVFNHILETMFQERLFLNVTQKYEIVYWTCDSHSTFWCGVFVSVQCPFLESFDIWCIVFKLHTYLIIPFLDFTFSFGIMLVYLHEIHTWDNYKPSSHIY